MIDCGVWREAISARLDGEDPGRSAAEIDRHLLGCSGCSAFAQAIQRHPSPSAVWGPTRPLSLTDTGRWLAPARFLLLVLGVVEVCVALLALVEVSGDHGVREAAALELAIGVGFVMVAARPHWAPGMAPVALVAAALVLWSALPDLVGGATGLIAESHHLLEVTSALAVAYLARAANSSVKTVL